MQHERVDREPLPGDPDEGEDQERRDLVRFLVPAPVAAAFDEGLDLFRAVSGAETSVTEFIEMLVADARAGRTAEDPGEDQTLDPPSLPEQEISIVALRRGRARAAAELALARTTDNWSHLPRDLQPGWAFALAGIGLADFEAIAGRAGEGDALDLDSQILSLIRLEDELERRLGGLLADMADRRTWSRLRFDGVGHYAEQRLGMSRSSAEDRVRAHRRARRIPVLRAAYEHSEIGLDAVLRLGRIFEEAGVTDDDSRRAWIDRARVATVKRVRDEVRALTRMRKLGSVPFRDMAQRPPDDETWQRSVRREPGMAKGRMEAFGRALMESPLPDTFLRFRLPAHLAASFLHEVRSARRRLARQVERISWDEPWPGPDAPASLIAARMFSIRCRRTPEWVGLLALLEGFVDTWDDPASAPRRASDAVYNRDGWRCTAPGCTSRRNLEDHHVIYRSAGGSDDADNRVCICRFHHRMGEHGGLAECRGTAPLGITWTIGRGGIGGRFRNEVRCA